MSEEAGPASPQGPVASSLATSLLQLTSEGLYCPVGGFHIDPWRPVPRAVVTHAHADHATWGSEHYLVARAGQDVFRVRLGDSAAITTLAYGEAIEHNGVRVSLHPAGHVLGSGQVRLEYRGEVVVVSGDYKLDADPTCVPFEAVRCDRFITESTFGLPIYRWANPRRIIEDINDWWSRNRDQGQASVIYAYALGKAQRILAQVDATIGPIVVHGAVERLNRAYRTSGVHLPPTQMVSEWPAKQGFAGALVVAPPSAQNTPWVRRFAPSSEAVASGWMAVRGIRRRRVVDRGFVLSDHADWDGLNRAVLATGAEHVSVTHGYSETFARWLRSRGLDADVVATRFEGEADEAAAEEESS